MTPFGSYMLLKPFAEGGSSTLYLARRTDDPERTPRVLKKLNATSPEQVQRFEHEARAAMAIDNPHVVRGLELGNEGGQPYFVMELIIGVSMAQLLHDLRAQRRFLPAQTVIELFSGGFAGLEALQAAGVMHRDLSPQKLLVAEDGSMRLIDLALTKSSDQRADLFALSTLLSETLALAPHVPPGLEAVLARALSPDVKTRPASARALMLELAEACASEPLVTSMVEIMRELYGATLASTRAELEELTAAPAKAAPLPTIPIALGMVAVVAITAALTISSLRPVPPPPAQPIEDARVLANPVLAKPLPGVEQREADESDELDERDDQPAHEARRPRKHRRPRLERLETERDERPVEASVEEQAQDLVNRARALRDQQPENAQEIDQLIADALLWSRTTDRTKAKRELEVLDERLGAMR